MTIESARSFLFTPADRPDRFAKALDSGADVVVLDLEDAIRPEAKGAARRNVVDFAGRSGRGVLVRVNGPGTSWIDDDLSALAGLVSVAGVMVPKAEDPGRLGDLARRAGKPVVALIESVRGLMTIRDIAATQGVARLAFGSVDFCLDAGMQESALDAVRTTIVLESRHADLPAPADGVTVAFRDANALADDIGRARDFGFGGKLCIHPAQVAPVNAGFVPSEAEIAEARRIVAADEASDGGATALDGAMLDLPVVERARRTLARAAAATRSTTV